MGSLSHTDIILKEVYCHSTEKFSVCYRASNMNKHLLGGNHDFYRYSDASYAPCHPGIFTRSTRHHLLGEAVLFNGMPRSSLSSHCDSGWIKGLWASGLSISTSLGFRDANEASSTQVVDVVDRIADLTGAPILVDGDSGFGNFNNARLLAYKLWQ